MVTTPRLIFASALLWSAAANNAHAIDACRAIDIDPAIEITPGETILIIGELHGHQQGPQAMGDLACQLAGEGHSVALLLEMNDEFSEPLSRLTGEQDEDHPIVCEALAPFWEGASGRGGDGRSSVAIAELILRMGRLNAASASQVSVMAMDASDLDMSGGPNRQRRNVMSHTALQALDSHDVVLINVGNAHPTAIQRRLLESDPSLNVPRLLQIYPGGAAWNCTPQGCGEREWSRPHRAVEIELSADLKIEQTDAAANYDAVFHIGSITASPPVIQSDLCGDRFAG